LVYIRRDIYNVVFNSAFTAARQWQKIKINIVAAETFNYTKVYFV